jgi:hypothetical protein
MNFVAAALEQGRHHNLKNLQKAHATRKLDGRTKWRGLDISIENAVGSIRRGADADGRPWETKMQHNYGYFKGSQSNQDSDHIDCALCPERHDGNDEVYIIHTVNPVTGNYDEDKCYLAYQDSTSALNDFWQHYDEPEKHFGAMTTMQADDFIAHIKGGRENWDKPLVPRAAMKVRLQRKANDRVEAMMQERRDWMRGVIETAKAEELEKAEKVSEVSDGEQKRRDHIYSEFHRLCNMSGAQVLSYAKTGNGKKSGLSRGEAAKQGIASGRQRPAQIAHLKSTAKTAWTSADYSTAGHIVSFISRMLGAAGPMTDDKGQPTRKKMSLLIWGHNPGGSVSKGMEVDDAELAEIEKSMGFIQKAMSNAQMTAVGNSDGRRLLKVIPGYDAMDLQNEYIGTDILEKYWSYYEACGNGDLEHLTKKGGADFEKVRAALYDQGFPMENSLGRINWEVGRPVPGSFDPTDGSLLIEVYQGPDDVCGPANWFWRTLTEVSPPWVWKPSVAGRAMRSEVIAEVEDPRLAIGSRKQKVNIVSTFLWDNIGFTLEPVQHWVSRVEIARDSVQKGVDMSETEMIQGIALPAPEGMTPSSEVVKSVMFKAAQLAINDMLDAGEITTDDVGILVGELSKSLAVFGEDLISPYVSKALEYGVVTTESRDLAAGAAATRESLSGFKKRKMARELYEDTKKGLTPFQKGWQPSDEGAVVDIADFLADEYGIGGEDALDVTEIFVDNLPAWAAGQ